ncbi:hypothetical protein DPMN_049225 [Dreissena polymorpha]|uniref:Uncharacterized protein n=1 Tax=Dreissena polymorpha TaxID=45954 RepID=A0A9D4CEJ9_DREPO|nr:hypothetical protein DPMN_049225 [Dreissena polymorpha]
MRLHATFVNAGSIGFVGLIRISNEAYRQAKRGDDVLHFICRQCEERNWPEITDADEGDITSTDQQWMDNSTSTDVSSIAADTDVSSIAAATDVSSIAAAADVSSIAADLEPLDGTFNITQRTFDVTMEPTETFVYI